MSEKHPFLPVISGVLAIMLVLLSACNIPLAAPTASTSNKDTTPPIITVSPVNMQSIYYNGAACGSTNLTLNVTVQDDSGQISMVGIQYRYRSPQMPNGEWKTIALSPNGNSTYSASIPIGNEAGQYLHNSHGVIDYQVFAIDAAGNYQTFPANSAYTVNVQNCALLAAEQRPMSGAVAGSITTPQPPGNNNAPSSASGNKPSGNNSSGNNGSGNGGYDGVYVDCTLNPTDPICLPSIDPSSGNSGSGSGGYDGVYVDCTLNPTDPTCLPYVDTSSGNDGTTTFIDCSVYPNDPLCQPVVESDLPTPIVLFGETPTIENPTIINP